MALDRKKKNKLNKLIYEVAYELEQRLSDNNFLQAKIAGLNPSEVPDVSLKCAVKFIKKLIEEGKTELSKANARDIVTEINSQK